MCILILLVFDMEWHHFIAVFHGWPSPRLEVQSLGMGWADRNWQMWNGDHMFNVDFIEQWFLWWFKSDFSSDLRSQHVSSDFPVIIAGCRRWLGDSQQNLSGSARAAWAPPVSSRSLPSFCPSPGPTIGGTLAGPERPTTVLGLFGVSENRRFISPKMCQTWWLIWRSHDFHQNG